MGEIRTCNGVDARMTHQNLVAAIVMRIAACAAKYKEKKRPTTRKRDQIDDL